MRSDGRSPQALRAVEIIPNYNPYAEGSCLIKMGATHVICTATVEEKVPPFLRNTGSGWVTAEYGMIPRSTHERVDREAAKGKQSGRTLEIQRLIGRSLRCIMDLKALGERQIRLDCDVIQADGGTRTASITGSYVALNLAISKLLINGVLTASPLKEALAAVSCGLVGGQVLLDLNYTEDSQAEADANFVLTSSGKIIEIQTTAEKEPFEEQAFMQMLQLAREGIQNLLRLQEQCLIQYKKEQLKTHFG